jgi:uncharacterized protein (DUF58 family)
MWSGGCSTPSTRFDRDERMNPLDAPGVSVDTDELLKLRHLVRDRRAERLLPTGRPGGFVSRRRGRGLESIDIRAFAQGDDIRHIDRNTTARTGIAHVRVFHDEREKTALLMADFRPSMLWGTSRALRSVAAAEVLAAIGWRVVEAGGRIGLIAFGAADPVFVPPRARTRGMAAVIGGLVTAHRAALESARGLRGDPEPNLERAIDMAAALLASDTSVFLASALDSTGDAFDGTAAALARRTAFTVILTRDAFERSPPIGSYPYLSGPGPVRWATVRKEGAALGVNSRVAGLRRSGIRVVPVDVGQDAAGMLRQLDKADERIR